MALSRCRECHNVVSTDAKACPNCGARVKSGIRLSGCLLVILAPVFVCAVGGSIINLMDERGNEVKQQQEAQRIAAMTPMQRAAFAKQKAAAVAKKRAEEQMSSARLACRGFVEATLHDPATAQFEDYETYFAEEGPKGRYRVQVRVRAKNAFNATRQAIFDCDTKPLGKNWLPLRLEQVSP